jgi:CheY-like chemotaxis protein
VSEKPTILVVDDNVDTRELLHLYLTGAGFTVIIAADGGEGLYRAQADRPDLIITDINMPNLSGNEMIRQLRQQPELAATPVIALTAYGQEYAEGAVRDGATEALSKPMNFDELVARAKALLGMTA